MNARISEVIITLTPKYDDTIAEAAAILKKAGVKIDNADDDNSVIEGTVDVGKVKDLEKLDCVNYVRTVFTYDAEIADV
ncbi:MAG TPA: hypothetical protein VKK61_04775 [Tepidisphaeraceae bacterium]|nr:hypothetical protein [Tepidisphaeraceae bacterium]